MSLFPSHGAAFFEPLPNTSRPRRLPISRRRTIREVPQEKWCPKCEVTHVAAAFRPDERYQDGLFCWCRGCERRYGIERRTKARAAADEALR